MKLKLSLLAAALPLCMHLSAQTYINNQIGTSAQSPGTFWIAGEGRSSAQFKVQKDGSNSVSSSFQLFNAAGTRGANLQLTGDANPGLSTWLHDGTNWVKRMEILANGSLLFSGGIVRLNNAASNTVQFDGVGVNPPTFNTRSAGTKIILYPAVSASGADYGIGIESGHLWFSTTQSADASQGFKFYGGQTQIARLSSAGNWDIAGSYRTTAAEGLRVISNNGYIAGYNAAGTTRSGYLQFNSTAATILNVDVAQPLSFRTTGTERMHITAGGNIGIGTNAPGTYKLAVEGTVGARKVKVTQASWADFVFDPEYRLPSLYEVEQFVKTYKHLPDIPSAKEVTDEGIDLGEMNKRLLQKIEEQMLYIIELNKMLKAQGQRIEQLEKSTSEVVNR